MNSHHPSNAYNCDGHASIPEQRIRDRAYEIYKQRGSKGGHAEGDWLTAEAELKELKAKSAAMLSAIESLTEPEE